MNWGTIQRLSCTHPPHAVALERRPETLIILKYNQTWSWGQSHVLVNGTEAREQGRKPHQREEGGRGVKGSQDGRPHGPQRGKGPGDLGIS